VEATAAQEHGQNAKERENSKMPVFQWNEKRMQAAELVAGGWHTEIETAAKG
jgi:hypothetical protein